MITGNEQIYPTTDSNYINTSDDAPTIGLWGGLTLYQHMVIEFTKALLGRGEYGASDAEGNAIMAIGQAQELIRQLNKDESKQDGTNMVFTTPGNTP